jgi:hypothetical protein
MKNGRTERPGKKKAGHQKAGNLGVDDGGDAIILVLCGVYAYVIEVRRDGTGLAGFMGGLMVAWCL